MSAETAQGLAYHPPRKVALDALEAELVKLWHHPEQAEETQGHAVRACMSNLIVHHRAGEGGPQEIDQTLVDIVRLHPCRVLLLSEEGAGGAAQPETFVSAHVDSSHQAFCEQVTLKTGESGLARLPSIVRPLILEDLPTSLWWSTDAVMPLKESWFQELTDMVDQVIYDSFIWRDARQRLIAVTDWLGGAQAERSAADLAWRRLRPWRRIIAQGLDPSAVPGALEAISEFVLEHGPHALPQAWLLASWMAQRLGWRPRKGNVTPGTEITWSFEGPASPVKVTCRRLTQREYEITAATIAWRRGSNTVRARFSPPDDARLSVSYEGIEHPSRVLAVPKRSPGQILARQLPDFGRDPLFAQTLELARGMALAMEA